MLARTVARLQHAVLQNARLAPVAFEHSFLQGGGLRFFGSGYLDRNQVTERILSSVKNFEKVDPNKVNSALCWTVTSKQSESREWSAASLSGHGTIPLRVNLNVSRDLCRHTHSFV